MGKRNSTNINSTNINSTNIYDALIGSGELGLVTSSELQNQLADLNLELLLLASYEEFHVDFEDDHLYPNLNKYIDALTTSEIATQLQEKRYHYDPVQLDLSMHKSRFNTNYEALLDNKEFANQLVQLIKLTAALLPIYWRIKDTLKEIREILIDINPSLSINLSDGEE